jgi:hypothetical protein
MTDSRTTTRLAAGVVRRACLTALYVLSASLVPYAAKAAESAAETEQQCMGQVRRELIQRKLKQLDKKTLGAVKEYCQKGDTKGALAQLDAGGDSLQQCVREINTRIKRSGQDVAQEIVAQAQGLCRAGDLAAALEVIDSATASSPTAPPSIASFTADRSEFKEGESVTLSWTTENATKAYLAREDREAPTGASDRQLVATSGSAKVEPPGTSTYLLWAVGFGEQAQLVQRKLEVRLDSGPNIFRFQANPTTIRARERALLTWDVYGAEQVRLGDQDVDARSELSVSPSRKTYYKLRAWSSTDQMAEDVVAVSVSPFPAAQLSPAVARIELCSDLETSGGSARCLSSDGPFYRADDVQVIVLFRNLAPGSHSIERTFYRGKDYGTQGWKRLDSEDGKFHNPRQGDGVATFAIPPQGTGILKLEIVLDGDPRTRSEIKYCVECPGHDEW